MSIRSLDRSFDIIEYLAGRSDGATVGDIAGAVDLPVSTVYRIVTDLMEIGYLSKDRLSGTLSVGRRFVELSRPNLRNLELRAEAAPILSALARFLETKVFLAVPSGSDLTYIDMVLPAGSAPARRLTGSRRPLHSTALGKALLMGRNDTSIRRTLGDQLEAFTSETITDIGILLKQIGESRLRGWTEDLQEDNLDCCCIAAPVAGPDRMSVAAVSASWSAAEFRILDRKRMSASIVAAAGDISSMLVAQA